MKITGITVGTTLPKSNFDQTDPSKGDFIKGDRSFLNIDSTLTNEGSPADAKAVGVAIESKQDVFTGTEGQVVQIDVSGKAIAAELELITVDEIDAICGGSISYAEDVMF